jgi:hypothetical protein
MFNKAVKSSKGAVDKKIIKTAVDGSDSEEERFIDADKMEEEENKKVKEEPKKDGPKKFSEEYDPLKREPKFAHA